MERPGPAALMKKNLLGLSFPGKWGYGWELTCVSVLRAKCVTLREGVREHITILGSYISEVAPAMV